MRDSTGNWYAESRDMPLQDRTTWNDVMTAWRKSAAEIPESKSPLQIANEPPKVLPKSPWNKNSDSTVFSESELALQEDLDEKFSASKEKELSKLKTSNFNLWSELVKESINAKPGSKQNKWYKSPTSGAAIRKTNMRDEIKMRELIMQEMIDSGPSGKAQAIEMLGRGAVSNFYAGDIDKAKEYAKKVLSVGINGDISKPVDESAMEKLKETYKDKLDKFQKENIITPAPIDLK